MILTFQEDGVLRVYPTVEDVVRHIEPLDAQETLRAAFDETGQTYELEWVRPNQISVALFGLLKSVLNGEYRLNPTGKHDREGLLRCIRGANDIEPTEQRDDVLALAKQLT